MGQKTETAVHVNPTVKSDKSLKTQKEILLLKYCATELATAVKEREINRKGGTSKMDLPAPEASKQNPEMELTVKAAEKKGN